MLMPTLDLSVCKGGNRNRYGYLQFGTSAPGDATPDDYACCQHAGAGRVTDYLLPYLVKGDRILDVGCGVGALVKTLVEREFDAYGVDVPATASWWAKAGNDDQRFFSVDATDLPFENDTFDVVTSFGVIEHIGTELGYCTLREDYWEHRRSYAREILRVTRPGGTIIISCPNKSFPIDIQHGPTDSLSQPAPIRSFLFNKTGMNIHKTWGRYHLLSYREVRGLFHGARHFTPLPLKGYFGFGRFSQPFLRPFSAVAQAWIDHMPGFVAESCLNPYVMMQITK
jgi:SAM-dependent methyltransferase